MAAVMVLLAIAAPAVAQDEAALKRYFEGRRVTLKLDMPATSAGVDIHPELERPLDFKKYGTRVTASGVAIREGDVALVTLVKVKKDIIEFQLAGGGYDGGTGYVSPEYIGKSNLEKQLEKDVKAEKDASRKRQLQRQLDDEKSRRERDQRRANEFARREESLNKERIAVERLRAGSRFNLRYEDAVPAGLTPEDVMALLRPYIDFSGEPRAAEPAPFIDGIRKGMLRADVERMLGSPQDSSQRREGVLSVVTLVFVRNGERISAEFVEDVLIRYTISSR